MASCSTTSAPPSCCRASDRKRQLSRLSAGTGYLDAQRLAEALRSGIYRVVSEQETLNRINVFPVPDGDTGTNLSATLGAALQVLSATESGSVGGLLTRVADALLDSARGNSGAIVAQFFQGVSDRAVDLTRIRPHEFSEAIATGNEYAHDALSEPREGTILSVIAAFSAGLRTENGRLDDPGFAKLLEDARDSAREALARTRNQLEELRRANVVDAGAMGFLAMVEGMVDFLVDGVETERPALAGRIIVSEPTLTAGESLDLRYRFCTECVVSGAAINRRKLRERLSEVGDSLVLAGTKRKLRIHIHTDDADAVFAIAGDYGEVSAIKADDMDRQQQSTHRAGRRFAVITDSAADIPDEVLEALDIHMVPCRIQFGDHGYLDKVTITSHEFFHELATNPQPPSTSQPSPGDFRRQFQYLASHFPDVLSINLTPSVSGTYQAAVSAASRTNASGRVHVIDSQNASLGQGLVATFAAECAAAGLDIETSIAAVRAIIPSTTSFGLIRDLSYAVRGGRVPASKKWLAEFLHVTPVIRTRPDGSISASGILPGKRRMLPKFVKYVARRCRRDRELRIAVGHAVCEDEARELLDLLLAALPNVTRSSLSSVGSALGAHGGPGSLVVSVQEYQDPRTLAVAGA